MDLLFIYKSAAKDNLAKHYYRIREKIGIIVARIHFYSWSVLALVTPCPHALAIFHKLFRRVGRIQTVLTAVLEH